MALAWRVFMQFEARDYTPEGIESFQDFITDSMLYRMFLMGEYQLFAAYDRGRMIGMISLRNETHISLLFVDANYHRHGIGRQLIQYVSDYVLREEGHDFVTVNAAPYAVEFYHRIGFVDTDVRQFNDGIWYTPMRKCVK
ncbi:MAG: GNAT family N-acetyltransferase [Lachnospiraceae bacterium]|nr:GNAT family N-acetyltransferase [Lachnospiraceae bacterium]